MHHECRQACGGQGIKTENRVGHLKSEYDGQPTFEGDNNVLMQQEMIIRNEIGELEAVVAQNLTACMDAEHVETLALLQAIQFAKEMEITHVVFEGDAVNVINKLNSKVEDLSMTGHLIAGAKTLLKEFHSVKVNYINRKANEPAHLAAKLALSVVNSTVWFMNFPPHIVLAVNSDLQK